MAVMHQCVTHDHNYHTRKQLTHAILRIFRKTLPNAWDTFRNQVPDSVRVVTYQKFRVLGQAGPHQQFGCSNLTEPLSGVPSNFFSISSRMGFIDAR